MQTVSNYDGIITIPSKMNDLEEWEVNLLFPKKNDIPVYPKGIRFREDSKTYEIRKYIGGENQYVGSKTNSTDAVILLEQYCTEHKLKLF